MERFTEFVNFCAFVFKFFTCPLCAGLACVGSARNAHGCFLCGCTLRTSLSLSSTRRNFVFHATNADDATDASKTKGAPHQKLFDHASAVLTVPSSSRVVALASRAPLASRQETQVRRPLRHPGAPCQRSHASGTTLSAGETGLLLACVVTRSVLVAASAGASRREGDCHRQAGRCSVFRVCVVREVSVRLKLSSGMVIVNSEGLYSKVTVGKSKERRRHGHGATWTSLETKGRRTRFG